MVEVILVKAQRVNKDGAQLYFVEIKGIPEGRKRARTMVVTNGLELENAETVKREIEDALDEYRRPKRTSGKRRPKTSWARLMGD